MPDLSAQFNEQSLFVLVASAIEERVSDCTALGVTPYIDMRGLLDAAAVAQDQFLALLAIRPEGNR